MLPDRCFGRAHGGRAPRGGRVHARASSCRGSRRRSATRFRSSGCTCCASIAPNRSCSTSRAPTASWKSRATALPMRARRRRRRSTRTRARASSARCGSGAQRPRRAVVYVEPAPTPSPPTTRRCSDSVADLLALALQHDALAEHRVAPPRAARQPRPPAPHDGRGARHPPASSRRSPTSSAAALPHDILALTSWAEDGTLVPRVCDGGRPGGRPGVLGADDPRRRRARAAPPRPVRRPRRRRRRSRPDSVRGRHVRAARRAVGAARADAARHRRLRIAVLSRAQTGRASARPTSDFARRVADHLALALSHQRLAEAARRDAAARETAAQLEAQVATLTRELEARTGQRRVVGHSRAVEGRPRAGGARRADRNDGAADRRVRHRARKSSRGSFTTARAASTVRSSRSTARRCPTSCSNRSCSATSAARLPARSRPSPGGSSRPTAACCSSTRSARWRRRSRPSCCACSKSASSSASAARACSHADIRVIAATNRDLHAAMRRGEFREDLYYRLGVFEIALPPLRERLDDILELADAFLEEIGATVGRPAAGIAREAKDQLLAYAWPGNVRELRNAIERAVILADGGVHPQRAPAGDDPRSAAAPRPSTADRRPRRVPAGRRQPGGDRALARRQGAARRRATTRRAPPSCSASRARSSIRASRSTASRRPNRRGRLLDTRTRAPHADDRRRRRRCSSCSPAPPIRAWPPRSSGASFRIPAASSTSAATSCTSTAPAKDRRPCVLEAPAAGHVGRVGLGAAAGRRGRPACAATTAPASAGVRPGDARVRPAGRCRASCTRSSSAPASAGRSCWRARASAPPSPRSTPAQFADDVAALVLIDAPCRPTTPRRQRVDAARARVALAGAGRRAARDAPAVGQRQRACRDPSAGALARVPQSTRSSDTCRARARAMGRGGCARGRRARSRPHPRHPRRDEGRRPCGVPQRPRGRRGRHRAHCRGRQPRAPGSNQPGRLDRCWTELRAGPGSAPSSERRCAASARGREVAAR